MLHRLLLLLPLSLLLDGCSADISALAQDPATVSIHQVVQTPAWSITTDVTRAATPGATAAANASGTSVGSVSTSTTTSPSPGATIFKPVSQ